jgi:hypothetical protein
LTCARFAQDSSVRAREKLGTTVPPIRRVFIVTSLLSRRQVEERFIAIRGGEAPTPHFVQLYWLLMSYFSACTEVGAYPYVVCQE